MILNRQLPALISLWCFQKERCRQIASNAKIAAASDADRAVDMGRECLAPGIAVEQGWKHLQRQSGSNKQGCRCQCIENDLPRLPGRSAIFRQLHIRSEEHTSELQSLMRISYAVFCLQTKT